MNLMFMREFPWGEPTRFDLKICRCFDFNLTRGERISLLVKGTTEDMIRAKCHTIRPMTFDEGGKLKPCRYKVGMRLSFRHWSGKPYRSAQEEFAAGSVKLVQEIYIRYRHGEPFVFVDGMRKTKAQVEELAINDGFKGSEDFFRYFDKDFSGWLIHWTSVKY